MDYFLTSHELHSRVIDVKYQMQIEGSDHCPVSLDISTGTECVEKEQKAELAESESSDEEKEVEVEDKTPSKRAKLN